MRRIKETLLSNRAIYLSLSLQERTLGLDEFIKDWSSFFNCEVYFWNLSQPLVTKLEKNTDSQNYLSATINNSNDSFSTSIFNSTNSSISTKQQQIDDFPVNNTATIAPQANDGQQQLRELILNLILKEENFNFSPQIQNSALEYLNQSNKNAGQYSSNIEAKQVLETIINIFKTVYNSSNQGIYIIENIDSLINSKSLDIFQYELLKTWLIQLTKKFRKTEDFYLVLLGTDDQEWGLEEIVPQVKIPYLKIEEIEELLTQKFAELELKNSEKIHLVKRRQKF